MQGEASIATRVRCLASTGAPQPFWPIQIWKVVKCMTPQLPLCTYIYTHIHIYTYLYIYSYIYMYISIHTRGRKWGPKRRDHDFDDFPHQEARWCSGAFPPGHGSGSQVVEHHEQLPPESRFFSVVKPSKNIPYIKYYTPKAILGTTISPNKMLLTWVAVKECQFSHCNEGTM